MAVNPTIVNQVLEAASPIGESEAAARGDRDLPRDGIALCLSGGGFRAMLFHLGSLWRLNELGYLPKLNQISSVSGGSITAAYLGLRWRELDFEGNVARNFESAIVEPIRAMAERKIDVGAGLGNFFRPGSAGAAVTAAYRDQLFGDATLQDLPNAPAFVINASNMQSGALWRFTREYMADYRVGLIRRPRLSLATAVAASSAFPPFLSPVTLTLDASAYDPVDERDRRITDLHSKPYTTKVVLTDGGVYDNLGLETAWKNWSTILVSDGGRKTQADPRPWRFWPMHMLRVLNLIDNQVRNRRKDQVVSSFELRRRLLAEGEAEDSFAVRAVARKGAFWHMADNQARYTLNGRLDCPHEATMELANVSTRLWTLKPRLQMRLINWGYAACDTHMRMWVDRSLPAPSGFPYPGGVR